MAASGLSGLLALKDPSNVGGGGVGAGGKNSPAYPASDPSDDDLTLAAKDLLAAMKSKDPAQVAETLQNFVSMC